MNTSSLWTHSVDAAKTVLLPQKHAKEIREFCEELAEKTSYHDFNINVIDKNHVQVVGLDRHKNSMTTDFDFEKGLQTQVEKGKSYIFSIIEPHVDWQQEIRGTIDGVMKRARSISTRHDKDWSSYTKTEDYQNFISGNKFRRVETPQGVTFYRNIDGDWVELFPKK